MEFNTYEDAAELAIKYCLENLGKFEFNIIEKK